MRAVDASVLVRVLTRDDERQATAGDRFVDAGAWVPFLALAEAAWVLDAVYELSAADIAKALEMLLDHKSLVLEHADVVAAAIAQFRRTPAVGFSDCLLLESARKAGHLPLGTFDRALARLEGAERL